TRIYAGARLNGTTYSKLIASLKGAGITLDRKVLSELAVNEPAAFTAVIKAAVAKK
ncbi:MAG: 50S ribosomal protein L20, partial [Patescibacteria group bacterium]